MRPHLFRAFLHWRMVLWPLSRRFFSRDTRDAPRGSAALRFACGPLRTPHPADGQRDLFFDDRVDVRFFSKLYSLLHIARFVRYWHGRRMGRWRVAGDGSGAGQVAGNPQRNSAERLFDWIPAGGYCRKIPPARLGMASDVLDWRAARAAGALYPNESSRIGSVETASRGEYCAGFAHRCW